MARLQILRHPDVAAVYIHFSGDVTGADFVVALRGAYASPLRREGDASVWDLTAADSVVVDLPDLQALDALGKRLAGIGPSEPILIVAPQPDTFTLARLYSHYGARSGRRIEAVHARRDAWRRLGVAEPDYNALRPLLTTVPRYEAGASPRRA